LIFFMLSTKFVDESRIELQLPQASKEPAAGQKHDPIEVGVTASGEYRVNGQTLINTSPATLSAAVAKVAGEARVGAYRDRHVARHAPVGRDCHGRARASRISRHQHRDRERESRRAGRRLNGAHRFA
jgi:hypothetical protein